MTEAPAMNTASEADSGIVGVDPEDQLRADTYRLLGNLLGTAPDEATLALRQIYLRHARETAI